MTKERFRQDEPRLEKSHLRGQHVMGEMFIGFGCSFQQEKLGGALTSFFSYLTSHSVEKRTFSVTSVGGTEISEKDTNFRQAEEDMQISESYPRMKPQLLEVVSGQSLGMQWGPAENT